MVYCNIWYENVNIQWDLLALNFNLILYIPTFYGVLQCLIRWWKCQVRFIFLIFHLIRVWAAERGLSRRCCPHCSAVAAARLTLTVTHRPITRRSNQRFFPPRFKLNCVALEFDITTLHSKAQNENLLVCACTVLAFPYLPTPPRQHKQYKPSIISQDVQVTVQICVSLLIISLLIRINNCIAGRVALYLSIYIYQFIIYHWRG